MDFLGIAPAQAEAVQVALVARTVFAAVGQVWLPASGCGGRNRPVGGYNGYTKILPPGKKRRTTQKRSGDTCQLCGAHGSLQLADPVAADIGRKR